MNDQELEKKLKIDRVAICLNCVLFTDCEKIGMFEECEKFVEVKSNKTMVIVSLDEFGKLESRRRAR